MGRSEFRGDQIKDDSITGDDIDESTLGPSIMSGSVSGGYITQILNGNGTAGHGLLIRSYGNGDNTFLLDVEGREGKSALRVDADGHVGVGNHGGSLPAALSIKQYSTAPIINAKDSAGNAVFKIDGDGKVMVADALYHSGDLDTYVAFPGANQVNLVAGGHSFLKYDSGNILINNANEDRDTKIMADDGAVVLHVDAGTNKVGIGTTTPSELLEINAAADGDECFIQFQEAGEDRAKIGINTSNNLLFHNQFINKHIVFKVNDQGNTREALRIDGAVSEVVVNQSSESLVDFRVESDNNTHMLFVDGSVDNVGINDSTPTSTLTIMGSVALKVNSINAANDPGTSYSISTTDSVLLVNTRPQAQGGIDSAITLTLPDASDNPGMVLTIKDAAGYCDVNAITITVSAGDNIDGNPSTTSMNLPSPASWKKLISDGANSWYEIGS
tara:strand:- start:2262 stop:3593 length:1332 start_codon:yes stop_codon:yes gene_type:complete